MWTHQMNNNKEHEQWADCDDQCDKEVRESGLDWSGAEPYRDDASNAGQQATETLT